MPIARIELPDGRIARFEVPEGTSPQEVESFANQQFQEQAQPERSAVGEVARPFLQAAKQIAVGTLGSAGDLAQQAVHLPEAIGRTAGRAHPKGGCCLTHVC